jgi:hypothetical protein
MKTNKQLSTFYNNLFSSYSRVNKLFKPLHPSGATLYRSFSAFPSSKGYDEYLVEYYHKKLIK